MSTTIDQKVVEMRFDNKHFESNVADTMSTLDKFKQKLNLSGATKGLEEVNAAAKKIDFSGMTNGLVAVQAKFSYLQATIQHQLNNIVDSAVSAGKRIASALTIDPIKTGFSEYETQINAIQTILANTQSKGTTLDDVNAALDTLNQYADKTIYNFTEMTRNIGTFTAAGVDLDTSVNAIKGIANLAAVSGSTSQQASTAMYQLSQALASGTVKLQDWNSVVNAGMGGQVFQDALVRTAAVMAGSAENVEAWRKKNIDSYGSFRDSLTEGAWLTTEVLTATLSQFTGDMTEAELRAQGFTDQQIADIQKMATTANDAATKVKTFTQLWDTLKEAAQSGWTQTWEIIVGDFEEAKDLLTNISDVVNGVIGKSAEARNALLSGGLKSGWDQFLGKGISNEGDYIESVKMVAKEHGVAIDEMIKESGSFEKTLKDGWLTTEMISESVTKYADNIRNMSEEEREAAGYTEEHLIQIEALEAGIKDGSVSLDEFAEKMTKASGRENLIYSLWKAFEALVRVIKPIKEAFREIFPPATAEQLYSFTEALKNFTDKLIISEETSDKLKRTFKGLFAVLDIVKQAVTAVFKAVGSLFEGFGGLTSRVLDGTASVGDWLVKLNETIKTSDIFNKVLQNIVGVIKTVVSYVKKLVSAFAENIVFPGFEAISSFLNKLKERIFGVKEVASGMKDGITKAIGSMDSAIEGSKFLQMFQAIWNGVKKIGEGIVSALGSLMEGVINVISNANFSGLFDLINTIAAGGVAFSISKFLKSLTEPLEGLQGIIDGVTGILDGVRGCFEAYQTNLKANTLLKIAAAIGILAASLLVIASIDSEKLSASLGAVTVLFADLVAAMALFGKISGQLTGVVKTTTMMLGVSVAVLILASALKKVADIDSDRLLSALLAVAGLTAVIIAAAKIMSSGGKTMVKGATQMVIFAAAVKILASACQDLSELSWEELGKGLLGVGVLMAEISIFMRTAKFSGKMITTATGIVILSGAIKILATACKDFSLMSWGDIGKGLASIGGLLLEVAVFTRLTGNAKNVISTGLALIAIGGAIKIFVTAIQDLSKMSWEELGKGLAAIAGSLLAVAVAVRIMPKNMIAIGLGLIEVGAAITILTESLLKASGMSWEEIAKGLVALGGSMLILAAGLNMMRGTLGGSAAMLVAAGALAIIAPVLKTLGKLSWGEIAKGIIAIAGAFAVIGVAGAILGPVIPSIIGLSAALALVGVAALAIGGGVAAIAAAFALLSTVSAAGATAIVASLTIIVTGLASLIPVVIAKLGEGIIAFCNVIAEGAPAIGKAVKAVVLTIVDVLVECIPAISEGLLELISGLLDALVKYTPQIVDSLYQFFIGLIDGLARNLPAMIQSGVNLLMSFFSGVIDALGSIDTDVLLKGVLGVGLMAGIMYALSGLASLVPGAMAGVLGMGLVIAELALVLAAIGGLAQIPGLDWLINEGGKLLESVGVAIGSFVGGIVGGFMSGMSGQFPQIGADLSGFMTNVQPFIEGAKSIDASSLDGVRALTETILLLTATEILDALTSWLTGGSSLTEFGKELVPFGEAMVAFSNVVSGNIDNEAVTAAANAGKIMAEMAATIPNSGGVIGFFTGENDMSTFTDQLVPFGEAMVNFSNVVSGNINEDAIMAAANAGKIMAEMANTLPNSGGVVGFFTGENDMTTFADQLIPFGEAIVEFSTIVNGNVNEEAILAAANAGKMMAEMANTLPNSGGVVGFFTGENDMSTFGTKLVSFGASMVTFSRLVSGNINEEAVTAAANAGAAMAAMAETIPNTGGLVSFFAGDNDLGTFGTSLVKFGEGFAAYASSISGVNPEVVTTSTNAAQSLVELQKALPEGGGLFSSTTTLDTFGSQIKTFGAYLAQYYQSVSGIDASALANVVTEVNRLVNVAKNTAGLDTTGMTSFGNALTAMARADINGLIECYTGSYSKVESAAAGLMSSAVTGAESRKESLLTSFMGNITAVILALGAKKKEFSQIGQEMMSGFVTGIQDNAKVMPETILQITTLSLDIFKKEYRNFEKAGEELMVKLIAGIKTKDKVVTSTFTAMLSRALTKIKNEYNNFYDAGSFLVDGFAMGITCNTFKAEAQARAMALAALEAAKEELGIQSPSKKFEEEVGAMADEGMAIGVEENTDLPVEAAAEMANEVIETAKDEFDPDIFEKEIGKMITDKISSGILNNADSVKYAVKRTYEESTAWISEQKSYGKLSLVDEMAAWKRIQSRYKAGTEERKKADLEIFNLENDIASATEEYYKGVLEVQAETTQKRKDLEQEYYDKTQEINDKLKSDIEAVNKEYEDAVKSRADSIYNAYGMFDEPDAYKYVSGTALIENLEDQVASLEEWSSNLNNLSARGIDNDLLNELEEMGPSSANYIRALNNMSDEELNKFVSLWKEKHSLANDQASIQMEDMKIDTQKKIQELTAAANAELYNYRVVWNQNMQALNMESAAKLEELKNTWLSKLTGLETESNSKFTDMIVKMIGLVGEGTNWTESGAEIIEKIIEGVGNNSSSLTSNLEEVMGSALDAVSNTLTEDLAKKIDEATTSKGTVKQAGKKIGKDIDDGVSEGIEENKESVVTAAKDMTDETISTVKNLLGIQSPSKVFAQIGEYMILGLIEGVNKYTAMVAESSGALGTAAYDVFNATITEMLNLLVESIEDRYMEFYNVGKTLLTKFIAGIKFMAETEHPTTGLYKTWKIIIDEILMRIRNRWYDFYNTGMYMVEGFAQGILDNMDAAVSAAWTVANAAANAMTIVLEVNSPSRVARRIGDYFGLGFVKGILDYADAAGNAGEEMANAARNGLSDVVSRIADFINSDMDTQPTIRPVLDLSEVESGTARLSTLFSRTRAMSISTGMNRTNSDEIQNGETAPKSGNTYTFTQNNYSPKALSRLEIYRQTKNQFSAMKGLVEK